jgi:hypothetical protein
MRKKNGVVEEFKTENKGMKLQASTQQVSTRH